MPKKESYFKKGNKGGPGRPRLDPDLKDLRLRSRSDVEKTILKLYNYSELKLEEMLNSKEFNLWEKHIARIILKGIAKGDHASLTVLSDYIFGKRPERLEMNLESKEGTMTPQIHIILPQNGRELAESKS